MNSRQQSTLRLGVAALAFVAATGLAVAQEPSREKVSQENVARTNVLAVRRTTRANTQSHHRSAQRLAGQQCRFRLGCGISSSARPCSGCASAGRIGADQT